MELSDISRGEDVQLVMVTDIHLSSLDDARGRLLLDLIQYLKRWRLEYFILCGDIFDFCQGNNPYFRKKFGALGAALEGLAGQGTRIVFVEGNHEFDLAGLPWRGVEFLTEVDRVIEFNNGLKIALTHGDQIYNNWSYRTFRSLVKSGVVRWTARWIVPPRILDWYTSRHSHMSRAADKYRHLNHAALLDAMKKWLHQTGALHGVFGHFHVPYFQPTTADETGYIASCESWDIPNALVLYQNKFSRLQWDRHTSTWQRVPALSLDLESQSPR